MNRIEAIVYAIILFICCAALSVFGMQFGDFWAVLSTGFGTSASCVGTCCLMAKGGWLTRGSRGWWWHRFMFGVFALMAFVGVGLTAVALVVVA